MADETAERIARDISHYLTCDLSQLSDGELIRLLVRGVRLTRFVEATLEQLRAESERRAAEGLIAPPLRPTGSPVAPVADVRSSVRPCPSS